MHAHKRPGILGSLFALLTLAGVRSARSPDRRPVSVAADVMEALLAKRETYFAQARYTRWKL